MVRGGCKHCGQRTTNDRLCNECQRLERQDFFATGGNNNDDLEDADELEYECTACGREYTTDGSDPCPDCGARRRRYVGPLPGKEATEDVQEPTNPTENVAQPQAATDGGTETHSKYVVPTGSGYRGTYTVGADRKVSIGTAALEDLDWATNQSVNALEHDDGVALVQGPADNAIGSYQLSPRYDKGRVCVGQDVVDELEVSPGDDVRVYDLETDTGLLLVDADDDPRIATDGGHDHSTESSVPELVFEYTSITGRRRRVTIVPDTGGEAWRIEHERRAGEWRETGREPITEFDLHVRGQLEEHTARETDPDPRSQSAVPDGGNVRESFLTAQDHYCDICSRPFDTLDDLANHDCRRYPESG